MNEILNFLSVKFSSVNSYATLNTCRSAISLIHTQDVGNDESIQRFCKGASTLKPQKPRYDFTWDPTLVIDYLKSFHPNDSLSLDKLTKKLATLLALFTAQRLQTLSKIKVDNIKFLDETVYIMIDEKLKTTRINRTQPSFQLQMLKELPQVCVFTTLKSYMDRTQELRNDDANFLFISLKKPHKSVTTDTIGRWIKEILCASGVDVTIFKAHSTRHASTSAASRSGLNLEEIRKRAGWSEKSRVFATFYNRPLVHSDDFVHSIVNNSKENC